MKTATTKPVVTNPWKVKMENCTVWRSETARKFSLNPDMIRAKATLKVEGRVESTKNVSAVAKTNLNGGHPKSAPKGKGVGSCEEEETKTSQNVPLGTKDLESFAVLSDDNDTIENEVEVDEFPEDTRGMMPPLPPASWFKKTETLKHAEMHCGKFRKPCNGDHRDEESPFFDCWIAKIMENPL